MRGFAFTVFPLFALAVSCGGDDQAATPDDSTVTRVDVLFEASSDLLKQATARKLTVWTLDGEQVFEEGPGTAPVAPFGVRIAPRMTSSSDGFIVEASLLDADDKVLVTRRKQGRYKVGKAISVTLELDDACEGVVCGALDCEAGACATTCLDELDCDEAFISLDPPAFSTQDDKGDVVPSSTLAIPVDGRPWLVLSTARLFATSDSEHSVRLAELAMNVGDVSIGRGGGSDANFDTVESRGSPWMFVGVMQPDVPPDQRAVSLTLFRVGTDASPVANVADARIVAFPLPGDTDFHSVDLPTLQVPTMPMGNAPWESVGTLEFTPSSRGDYIAMASGIATQGPTTLETRPVHAIVVGPDSEQWVGSITDTRETAFANTTSAQQSFLFARSFDLEDPVKFDLEATTFTGSEFNPTLSEGRILAFRTDGFDVFAEPIHDREGASTAALELVRSWTGEVPENPRARAYVVLQSVLVGAIVRATRRVTIKAGDDTFLVDQHNRRGSDAADSDAFVYARVSAFPNPGTSFECSIDVATAKGSEVLHVIDASSLVFGLSPWRESTE